MKKFLTNIHEVMKSEDGQGMVEYGLIIGLISVAVIGALLAFGPQLIAIFTKASDTLETAVPAVPAG